MTGRGRKGSGRRKIAQTICATSTHLCVCVCADRGAVKDFDPAVAAKRRAAQREEHKRRNAMMDVSHQSFHQSFALLTLLSKQMES